VRDLQKLRMDFVALPGARARQLPSPGMPYRGRTVSNVLSRKRELAVMAPLYRVRPYQDDLENKLVEAWRRGYRRILLVLFVGGGKTFVAARVIARALAKGKRVLFIAHRDELIHQAFETFLASGIAESNIGFIQSGQLFNARAQIQIASIQTLSRRSLPAADLVFIDEAHRSQGTSYLRIFRHPGYARATFIGLTATPLRTDGQLLGALYDELVMGPKPSELVAGGFVASPQVFSGPMPDLAGLKSKDGDFDEASLARRCMDEGLVGSFVEHYQAHGAGQRAIGFAVNITHAEMLHLRFLEAGIRSAVLTGSTPREERRCVLRDLRSGEILVLWSVGVLLEGFDCPPAKVAIWARPTESLTVWVQGNGRVLRPHMGITPVILDHAGNYDRLRDPLVDREWSLTEAPKKERASMAGPTKKCPVCELESSMSTRACPECGHVFFEAELPAEVLGQLVLRGATGDPVERLRESFLHHWTLARKKGYKPNYVFMKVGEEMGAYPPKAWVREVDADYASNSEWKKRLFVRLAVQKKLKNARVET
jgi:DNA repair protein RadD